MFPPRADASSGGDRGVSRLVDLVGGDQRLPTTEHQHRRSNTIASFLIEISARKALIAMQFESDLYLRAEELMEAFGQHDGEVLGGCRRRMCTTTVDCGQ